MRSTPSSASMVRPNCAFMRDWFRPPTEAEARCIRVICSRAATNGCNGLLLKRPGWQWVARATLAALPLPSCARQEGQYRHHHCGTADVSNRLYSVERKEELPGAAQNFPRSLRCQTDGRCLKEPARLGSGWRTGDLILPCATDYLEQTDAKRRLIPILILLLTERTDLTDNK